jgi:hypothetical protein
VCSEISTVTIPSLLENAGFDERRQLTLQAGRASAQVLGELREKPPFLRLGHSCSQNPFSGFWEESFQGCAITHNA